MYLRNDGACEYDNSGIQVRRRGDFLILMWDDSGIIDRGHLYGFVRRAALRQCGHGMIGYANVNGKWIFISGAYGSDGLGKSCEDCGGKLPPDAVRVPDDLYNAWKNGGGWNSAGTEASAMRQWAIETFGVKHERN